MKLLALAFAPTALIVLVATSAPLPPAAAPALPAAAGSYKVDSVHSSVVFSVRYDNISNFWGRFDRFGGTFTLDPAAPENSSFNLEVEAASVSSANKKRDGHLTGPDFFEAKAHPKMTFASTKVATRPPPNQGNKPKPPRSVAPTAMETMAAKPSEMTTALPRARSRLRAACRQRPWGWP